MISVALLALAAQAEIYAFHPAGADLADMITPYKARQIELQHGSSYMHEAPAAGDPFYGSFSIGPKSARTTFVVRLDRLPGKPLRMLVDANHNWDFADDPRVTATSQEYSVGDETRVQYRARTTLQVPFAGGEARIPVELTEWPDDKTGKRLFGITLPGGTQGRVELSGETYNAALFDAGMSGDYTSQGDVWLRVDVNRNGRFDRKGERFPVGKPFNVGGRTYEAEVLSADGSKVRIILSTKAVPMELPPPALRAGDRLEPFEAKTIDGKTIRFPQDFGGKTVLLDFGTAWRQAWEEGLPVMGKLRREFGIEVVEIAMDQPEHRPALDAMLRAAHVDWPVVLQPKGWQDELPQRYGIVWAPVRILVDGWTGRLLVDSARLENPTLVQEVARAVGKPVPKDLKDALTWPMPSDVKDVPLYLELARRYEVDQAGRQLSSLGLADFLLERWRAVDHDNTIFMKRLLREGWPGKSRVGRQGSGFAWIMIQHADQDRPFQAEALRIMKRAVAAGEASGTNYAYLVDRVLVGQGKKQLYGTQMKVIDNTLEPFPIEDPANVDKRRKEMGMGTLRDYMEQGFKQFGYKIKPGSR